MLGIEEIVKGYRQRIERCESHNHAGQTISVHGNCQECVKWQVELLCLNRDPKTGQRFTDSTV